MRDFAGGTRHVGMVATNDAGRHWSSPIDLELPNPDAAAAGLRLPDGRVLLAFNNSQTTRDQLTLAVSENGRPGTWRIVSGLPESNRNADSVPKLHSYPWLLRGADGTMHLFHTANRTSIRHTRFNDTWLDQQLETQDGPS